jgi:hypothetical protein
MSRTRPIPFHAGALAAFLVASLAGVALADPLFQLDDFEPGELRVVGFELPRAARLDIEAFGVRPSWSDELAAYAWILDARTREPLWVMEEDDTDRVSGERYLRSAEHSLDLQAGRYEIYYWATPLSGSYRHSVRVFGLKFGSHRSWNRDSRRLEDALEECKVVVSAEGVSRSDLSFFEPDGKLAGSLVHFGRLGDEESVRAAFRLKKATDLEVYAHTELPEDWEHGADTGWIVDANTRERIWTMNHRNTKHAGGAEKNRYFRETIHLEKGDYVLYYGTDDSHSYPHFNAAPPLDPLNWGITLAASESFKRSDFDEIALPERGEPLVDLTRARDDDALEQAFRLKKESEIWVRAFGEYGWSRDEFADYGWIQKAGSSEIVWEMTERNTHHAGGAQKNREFDGKITLPAGEYVAYYVTDDSHAYRRWNAGPPFEPEAWGLALYPGDKFRASNFEKLDRTELAQDPNVLVRIVRVGDDERLRERFTLDKPTQVRIYALGEASRGHMYDFGYIENTETGDVVWEMTARNTRHAGGARKNRVYDGEILLEPGNYEVFYETDDSHSFGRWNAARPRDAYSWGITVTLASK